MKFSKHFVLLFSLLPAVCLAGEQHDTPEPHKATGVQALSSPLRSLLTEEMRAIQRGMVEIIPAYSSGNWSKIETIAGKIKNSYILKQKLTENQAKELHSLLPHEFIQKDQQFHYLAGMLEHVANKKKPELINFYFYKMNEACVSCHTSFATHKFPQLSPNKNHDHNH